MFAKAILVAGLAALAAAQSASLTFTSVPNPVTAGKKETISYKTNDESSPVTILLRKGPSTDLQTVSTLTSSATGGSYEWTPSSSLENGSDYALEIQQGGQTNYYGPFTINGASTSSSGSSSSSSSASASGYPSSSTMITSASRNITMPMTGTAPVSVGTGSAMHRNTTMSRPTLSSTSASGSASQTGASSSNGGAGFQGTTTGSGAAASNTSNSANTMTTGGSVAALVFGAVAAMFFA